ncbi:hypothetical protein J8L88_22355 [Aquimarina sp. MMG015]|uniref:hypothetical protein n=1 Tax=unclassified Aquimarina TaxID=2627091 RepID=UPI000E51D4CD|nr:MULTISPECIES: hypothetical protein [unclassified Aquimarina]AXT58527.1 hypothetical protein D1815_23230 [Aquimarina sp. AD1]MBQ4805622.1 hypothetical protein [Aquimarina sp. MMG015]RKN31548.1 hypothetical protein D7035_05905 [Aquimarina sp. AD1]
MKFFKNISAIFNRKLFAKNLFCGIGNSEIQENAIWFYKYPFEPSIIYPERLVHASEIESIGMEFGAIKIFLKDDIVFISAEKKETLKAFAERNAIPLSPYSWNWDWILEPYLDTELTKEHGELLITRLQENNFNETEIIKIRNEVEKSMYIYNFDTLLWEWNSLSLLDVLSAMRATYKKEDFRAFYKRALEIEKRN